MHAKEHHQNKETQSHSKVEPNQEKHKKDSALSSDILNMKNKDAELSKSAPVADNKDNIKEEKEASSEETQEEVVLDFISSLKKSYEEKLAAKEAELAKLKDQLLRAHADFDNARKRMLRDKTEALELANKGLLEELLPVLDHFQMALKSVVSAENIEGNFKTMLKGFELIYNQLLDVLSKAGLEPFDVKGKPFDPNTCEAIAVLETDEHPEGTIIEQVRRGYNYKQKLLRAAHVVVAKGKGNVNEQETTEHPAEE